MTRLSNRGIIYGLTIHNVSAKKKNKYHIRYTLRYYMYVQYMHTRYMELDTFLCISMIYKEACVRSCSNEVVRDVNWPFVNPKANTERWKCFELNVQVDPISFTKLNLYLSFQFILQLIPNH